MDGRKAWPSSTSTAGVVLGAGMRMAAFALALVALLTACAGDRAAALADANDRSDANAAYADAALDIFGSPNAVYVHSSDASRQLQAAYYAAHLYADYDAYVAVYEEFVPDGADVDGQVYDAFNDSYSGVVFAADRAADAYGALSADDKALLGSLMAGDSAAAAAARGNAPITAYVLAGAALDAAYESYAPRAADLWRLITRSGLPNVEDADLEAAYMANPRTAAAMDARSDAIAARDAAARAAEAAARAAESLFDLCHAGSSDAACR